MRARCSKSKRYRNIFLSRAQHEPLQFIQKEKYEKVALQIAARRISINETVLAKHAELGYSFLLAGIYLLFIYYIEKNADPELQDAGQQRKPA